MERCEEMRNEKNNKMADEEPLRLLFCLLFFLVDCRLLLCLPLAIDVALIRRIYGDVFFFFAEITEITPGFNGRSGFYWNRILGPTRKKKQHTQQWAMDRNDKK